jgi:nucleotidyltransferase AbiEii toxin of type IV toxin-antitoxin system
LPDAPRRRPPESADIVLVLAELARHKVEYALLGGTAMALHGFPRMTKDIDLLLPRDARNNARLLKALAALRSSLSLDRVPEKKTLDAGFSTSAEGELGIDLLFVAASRTFDDYRGHIVTRELEGVPVKVLDVDGMLMSKQTDRPEDLPDLQRLSRLKGAGGGRR